MQLELSWEEADYQNTPPSQPRSHHMPRGAASHDVLCQSPRARSPCNETCSDPAPPTYVALVPTVFAATWDGLPMLPRFGLCPHRRHRSGAPTDSYPGLGTAPFRSRDAINCRCFPMMTPPSSHGRFAAQHPLSCFVRMCQSPDQHLAQGSSIISSPLQARTRRHEMPMGAIMPPLMCIPLFSVSISSSLVCTHRQLTRPLP